MVTREEWSDAFNNQVADRTNVLDVASHYPYSPERWTLRVDGTRQLLQYNSVSQYNHAGDVHELKPAAGETVTLETAERPRYVVSYELAATAAFAVNQSLQSGDSLLIGLYDGTDGWYLEHFGSQSDSKADFVLERDGSEVYRKENIDIVKPVTERARIKLQTGWYDVTRNVWERSFGDGENQANREILRLTKDGNGSKTGNLPFRFEVTADANTSNLILEAGSCAQVNLGRTVPLKRTKTAVHTDTIDTTGSWIPLRAYRIDPNREIISTQLNDVDIGKYTASDDVELLVQSFDKSKVLDSGGNELTDSDFSTPEEFNSQNNVLETSTAVEQIPDSTGTVSTSVSNPGGFQVARGELFSASGNEISGGTTRSDNVKRPVYPRDYIVVLGKSGTTGDITYQLETEQDW